MVNENSTLHQKLKIQTENLHSLAYKVPYINSLLKNELDLICYTEHIRCFAIIHGALEHQLQNIANPFVSSIIEGYLPKFPLLMEDLQSLNADEQRNIIPAIGGALKIADNILLYSIENPYKLLGYLYVLEGSINGSSILKKHVQKSLNFQDDNCTKYFSAKDENYSVFWNLFIERINKIEDESIQEDIINAAYEIFWEILKIYESLFPYDESKLGNHITKYNPEAGNYPIPTEPKEISAALKAGIVCWDEFPYYEFRYEERGRRFAVSDAVWLVTLCDLTINNAIAQVNWLANFLAIRGMPVYTMEFQLLALYQQLSQTLPENEKKYRTFLKISEFMKENRCKLIKEEEFENSNKIFEDYLNSPTPELQFSKLSRNMGKLILGSILDDMNGIDESKNNLKKWLTDPLRFSVNWISAVSRTYTYYEHKLSK